MDGKRLALVTLLVSGVVWSVSASAGNRVSVGGTWEGEYTCGQGETGMELEVEEESGQLRAAFSFYEPSAGPEDPKGRFLLEGEVEEDGTVDLDPEEWIDRPTGFSMIGLEGEMKEGGDTFAGDVTGAGSSCTAFTVERKGGPDSVGDLEGDENDEESEEADEDAVKPVETEGFVSDFHEEHAGEVVFSDEPIPREEHGDFEPKSTFELGEPIYTRTFLEESLGNVLRKRDLECLEKSGPQNDMRMEMHFQIGDAPESDWIQVLESAYFGKDEFGRTTTNDFKGHSMTGTPDAEPEVMPPDKPMFHTFSSEVLSKLEPGENELTLHAKAMCETAERPDGDYQRGVTEKVASGSLTLKIEDADQKKQFWDERGPKLPEPKHSDQEQIAEAAEKRLREKWSNEEVLRVVTTDAHWDVKSHRFTGQPVRRDVEAMALVKRKDNGVCRVFYITIRQGHAGGGNYEEGVSIATGQYHYVPCAIE